MSNGSTNRVSHDRPEKGKRYQKNICRHCKKQFSTPASLLNHLQRHEALSGTWQKKFREQRMRKRNHFSFLHRGICQRSKVLSFQHSEKHGYLPETSIKLFLKYLDDVVASQNGAKSLKQKSCTASHNKTESAKSLEKQNHAQMSQIASAAKIENEAFKPRSGLKRSTSGLSPMQTLLEAAAIAEVSQDDVSSPTVSSSSSLDKGKYQEAVVVSTTSQSPTFLSELSDDVSLPPKKQRKSTRLATKRARNNKKKTENVNSCTEAKVSENAAIVTSHDPTLLTNLNLLSTVSLETAMRQRQMPTTLQGQEPISSCIPLPVLSPEMKISTTVFPSSVSTTVFPSAVSTHLPVSGLNSFHITHPTSQSVNIPPQILHNTSGGNVKISRSQNMASFTNTSLHSNSSLPPLPPLVYAGMHGASTLSSYSPHKQDSSVPQSLSSMLKSPVDIKQLTASTSVVTSETEAPKNHSSNSNCGAIDLSKPKLAQVKTNIPEGSEKNMDITVLSGLPHSLAQLVTSNDKLSEVLQNLVLMGKTQSNSIPPFKEIQPIKASGNGRQADSDLQARMFASARNYKIDNKGVTNSPQVQAVIASSSRMAQLGKGMKPGSLAQAEEVQCGYKWSGSGGLVKERTQMVRELVSADIMASFLAKTQPPAAAPHQLNISVFNTSQPQQLSPQLVLNSVSGRPSLNISQDQSASEGALNLITTKAPEIAGSSKKGVAGRLQKATSGLSSSPPLSDWGSTFAGSVKKSILRSSLTNTQPQQKLQPKAINLSQTNSPLTSSVPSMPTPSSNCTISSPSLAAMLRQPAATMHEPNHVSLLSSSPGAVVTSSLPAAQLSTVIDSSLLTHPRSFHIKVEPVDLYSPEQGTVIMALPLKTEKQDQVVEKMASEGDGSPKSLIVDINPD